MHGRIEEPIEIQGVQGDVGSLGGRLYWQDGKFTAGRGFHDEKNNSIALLALIWLGLSGCKIPTLTEFRIAPRGSWHGHIYVNECIGFQFELLVLSIALAAKG